MDHTKLISAIRPLALAFAGELADVLHKHYNGRVEAARKGAVDRLREDLENTDADVRADRKPARRQLPKRAAKRRPAGRRAARRDHRERAPAPAPRATAAAAPVVAKVTGVKTCSTCGEQAAIEADRKLHGRRRPTRTASGIPRKRTVARKHLGAVVKAEAFATTLVPAEVLAERPRTRGDCRDAERPCPWLACKYHLYLDVNPTTGSLTLNFPHLAPWQLQQTCCLDVADRGGITLEEVGVVTNLTRERIRQVEIKGLLTLKRHRSLMEVA